MSSIIRLCEGGNVAHSLDKRQREEVECAATSWREKGNLRQAPLWFSGEITSRLYAAQNTAGVVEVGDVTIEIYPKLDTALLRDDVVPDARKARAVLSQLMWMLEVGEHGKLAETDTAPLEDEPTSFVDLWAFLLGRGLLRELKNGVARTYRRHENDLPTIRGRIRILDQVTHNWNRLDHIACVWDEFTSDTALNRLFKCCLNFLLLRVRQSASFHLVESCLLYFEDVTDTDVATALAETGHFRWDRSTERFRIAFELARRLLKGRGHEMESGDADTFVFLVNMADVFEDYVGAVLAAHFRTEITTQHTLGTLFKLPKGGIFQTADYVWHLGGTLFIGDAKYKHLAAGHNAPLRFEDIEQSDSDDDEQRPLAGRVLSPSDVRQLTVYSELAREKYDPVDLHLLLLYPYVGINPCSYTAVTWNNVKFSLVPIGLHRSQHVRDCLPGLPP